MTRDAILKLEAGKELDEQIALLMGWQWNKHILSGIIIWRSPTQETTPHLPQFSTNIQDAWQVVEKVAFQNMNGVVICDCCGKPPWIVTLGSAEEIEADSICLAICRAALLTTIPQENS